MPDWLLNKPPRAVQVEALSRAYSGVCLKNTVDGEPLNSFVPGHSQSRPARGWAYFMEQRCGKTPTMLNEIALLRRDYDLLWCVLLSPNSFKDEWVNETAAFGAPFSAFAMESSNRKEAQRWIARQKDGGLLVVNYEALNSAENLAVIKPLINMRCLLVADESIKIKNRSSRTTRAALELSKSAWFKRILTGKPTTQGPHDLYAQLRFIGELNGIDPVVFRNTYCEMGGFQGKVVKGVKNEDQLHEILERCSFNARKVDWLKTPGKDYASRRIKLTDAQMDAYETMRDEFMTDLANGVIVTADQVITKILKLQQISSGFIRDEEGDTHWLVAPERNPKVVALKEMLDDEIDSKVIIVCQSKASLGVLEGQLAPYGVACIRGSAWHKENERDVTSEKFRFNTDRNCRVMLAQTVAVKYGHTLMGSPEAGPCYDVVFYENSYSLDDRAQVEERPQGVGQLVPITITDFVASQQDERIVEALRRKEDVASIVMNYARETGILPRGT